MTPELWVLIVVAIIGQSVQYLVHRHTRQKDENAQRTALSGIYTQMQDDMREHARYLQKQLTDERIECAREIAKLEGRVEEVSKQLAAARGES